MEVKYGRIEGEGEKAHLRQPQKQKKECQRDKATDSEQERDLEARLNRGKACQAKSVFTNRRVQRSKKP